MSRYSAIDPKGRKFVYGFDERLSYYFLDVVYLTGNWRHLVGLLSQVYGSAANVLERLDRYSVPIPDEHRRAMECDLPF